MAKAMFAELKLGFDTSLIYRTGKNSQFLLLKSQAVHVQYFQQKPTNQPQTLLFSWEIWRYLSMEEFLMKKE